MRDQVRLAIEYAQQDRNDEAIELLRSAVRANPENAAAWRWLAHLTVDPDEALVALRNVLRLRPDDAWARQAWPIFQERVLERTAHQQQARRSRAFNRMSVALAAVIIALCGCIGYFGSRWALPPGALSPAIPALEGSAPLQTKAHIETESRVEYYTFGGATIADIQSGLTTQGPQVEGGSHTIALTNYEIWVTWEMAQSITACQLREVVVHLEIVYTYPQWSPSGAPDPSATAEWERFITYVTQHEEHHGQIAVECAQDLAKQIDVFAPDNACSVAEQDLDTLVSAQYAQCEARQQAYDDAEGRTTFPLP